MYYQPFEQLRPIRLILSDYVTFKFIKNTALTYFLRLATSSVLTSFCILQKVKIMMSWLTQHVWGVRKIIVPWEDMCLLAMDSLHCSNHKKEKKGQNLFNTLKKIWVMPGRSRGIEPSSSASEVKVKNVKASSSFNSKQANLIYFIVCFSVYLVFFF